MRKILPLAAVLSLLCAVLLTPAPGAEKRERKAEPLPPAPPPAQPLTVQVKRGEPAEITLRIFGRKNEALKYLIRVDPRHGRVSEPKVIDREVSAVLYTPPADLGITRDRFSYAVQSFAGVSAAVEVDITIVDLPPDLVLPPALEFARLLVGATAVKPFELRNRGGLFAEGKVEVGEPWKIQGSPNYRLGAGERATFQVTFAPTAGGVFEGAVRLTSQPEVSVPVRGAALAALAVEPAKVVLQTAVGEPVRMGSFELSNQTDLGRRAVLSGGERLQVPTELLIPAQGKVSVPVQTAATDVAALSGEVRVESEGLVLRVAVTAPQVPGIIRAVGPSVAFGRVDAAQSATAKFVIENLGGTAAQVSWEIAAPFTTEEKGALLAPGEKKEATMRTQPAPPGKYRAWLAVRSGAQKLELPVEAELLGKPVPGPAFQPASGDARPESPAGETAAEPATPAPAAGLPREMVLELMQPAGVKLTRLQAKSAILEWPAALSAASQFRLERRRIVADPEFNVKVQWEVLPGVTVKRAGNRQIATLTQLRAGEVYGVRVVPVGPGAEHGDALFTQVFSTPEGPRFFPEITPVRVLLVVLIVCGALVLRQRRAGRARS